LAPEEIKSYPTLRAASLLGVLVIARMLTQDGTPVPISFWTPIAYLWQDVAVVLAFFLMDDALRHNWLGWTFYGLIVAYVALNVPVARVLSSPLTLPMIRAAGGPLADS